RRAEVAAEAVRRRARSVGTGAVGGPAAKERPTATTATLAAALVHGEGFSTAVLSRGFAGRRPRAARLGGPAAQAHGAGRAESSSRRISAVSRAGARLGPEAAEPALPRRWRPLYAGRVLEAMRSATVRIIG